MNRWKLWTGILVLALIVGVLITQTEAIKQVAGYGAAVNATRYGYYYLVGNDNTSTASTWTGIDSAMVDTSIAYPIVPGSFVAVVARCDAAADTVARMDIYASLTDNIADAKLIDTMGFLAGTTRHMRYVHGPAAALAAAAPGVGLCTPVMARNLWFVVTNDDGTALADTATIVGYVVTSPSMND